MAASLSTCNVRIAAASGIRPIHGHRAGIGKHLDGCVFALLVDLARGGIPPGEVRIADVAKRKFLLRNRGQRCPL
jgi:hypothetical protein